VERELEDTAPAAMGPIIPPMPIDDSNRPAPTPLCSEAVSAIRVVWDIAYTAELPIANRANDRK